MKLTAYGLENEIIEIIERKTDESQKLACVGMLINAVENSRCLSFSWSWKQQCFHAIRTQNIPDMVRKLDVCEMLNLYDRLTD